MNFILKYTNLENLKNVKVISGLALSGLALYGLKKLFE